MIVQDPQTGGYYRQVIIQYEHCGKQRKVNWHTVTHGRKDHRCRSCASKLNNKGKVYSPEWREAIRKGKMKSPYYKGFRYTGGYKLIHSPGHPRVHNHRNQFVPEHILVLEQHLGRYIEQNARVHHINGNKLDNRIENLYLCEGQNKKESIQMHNACHYSAEQLTMQLVRQGAVQFVDGQYSLTEEATARLFAEVFDE